ncbi:hypothetical protein ACE6H2_023496 [Prunus campanulata]
MQCMKDMVGLHLLNKVVFFLIFQTVCFLRASPTDMSKVSYRHLTARNNISPHSNRIVKADVE